MIDSRTLPDLRPLLGVEHSVLGRTWRDRCAAPERQAVAATIAQSHGLPDLVARVLAGRDVAAVDVPGYLTPRLRDLLPDPAVLIDMEAAAARLADAAQRAETVAIFGDYDVDGAASAALLASTLEALGARTRIHIPDRITEGYGPNIGAIRALAEGGATLLVTVDCGTAGHEPLAAAAPHGHKEVVLDHHQADERLPIAHALVNPNRRDDLSGLGHLCAAGVVFLTLVALMRTLRARGTFAQAREPDLMAGLDLVALATVADVVPLTGLNRAFVRQGLAVMRGRGRLGLAALIDAAGLAEAPEAWHLGYLLGPRINAGGRIGDAGLGARLLTTADPAEAARVATELDRLNRERRAIEVAAVAEAEVTALRTLADDPQRAILVVSDPGWHPGVVGLIAARLKERFGRPAFAFAVRPDGSATGSGRSIPGADIGAAVRAAVEAGHALKGGGHAMAAGATVAALDITRYGAFLADALAGAVGEARRTEALLVDGLVTAGGASASVVTALAQAGPFGQGAPEPVLALGHHRVVDASVVGEHHVRVRLRSRDGVVIGGVAFRAAEQPLGRALCAALGAEVHAAGTLARDRWRGADRVELRLIDLATPA